jgi:hypothetical protein
MSTRRSTTQIWWQFFRTKLLNCLNQDLTIFHSGLWRLVERSLANHLPHLIPTIRSTSEAKTQRTVADECYV